jgi:transposase
MTREEILAVLECGPDAGVTLVEQLLGRIARLEDEVQELRTELRALQARLHLDSHNSGSPPSRDPEDQRSRRRRRAHSLREATQRPRGGQPGHPGHTLCASDHPAQVVAHYPPHCAHCQTPFAPTAPVAGRVRRQVFDLPPLRLEVTEHQAWRCVCAHCGGTTTAPFPPHVTAPVQYGPHLLALATYLQEYQLLPLARTRTLLEDVLQQPVSEAVLLAARETAAQGLRAFEAVLRPCLRAAPVAHFDETGLYVASQRQWLHTVSTPTRTLYAVHPHRGMRAMDAMGILPGFTGVAEHDAYNAYWPYPCRHALCNVHHLRELTYQAEEEGAPWALPLKHLLEDMRTAVQVAREQARTTLPPAVLRPLLRRYGRLLAWGLARHPAARPPPGKTGRPKQSKARNLLERLRDRREAVLRFLFDFAVPFDNNLAERDLRMMKVQQKISGCFRTQAGAEAFCRIRSYLSTALKQGHDAYSALQQLFEGHPLALT